MAIVPPIGTIMAYAGPINSAWEVANGWLLCNGRLLDRTANDPAGAPYQGLFNAIGSGWGGDGVNGFNIPDLQGRFLRGVDNGSHRDPDAASRDAPNPGGHTGDRVGSLQSDQYASHAHTANDRGHAHPFTVFNTDGHGGVGAGFPNDARGAGTDVGHADITVQPSGGRETRPCNAAVFWIVRYK